MAFRERNQELADAAIDMLQDEHPMTLRQLYYRLVSAGALGNRPGEYKRLGYVLTQLREAEEVPFTWLVDHIRQTLKPSSWSALGDFGETVRHAYRKNFWPSMPHHVAIFVEKDAVAGTLQPITEKYDIALHVARGYASLSFVGEIAEEWQQIEKPIYAYYLGDHDPSGMDLERDLREKLRRYSKRFICGTVTPPYMTGDHVVWERLAVQPEDFDDFDLIELPVKRTDTRAAAFIEEHGEECAELDAIPPNELRRRVETAILGHVDADKWKRLLAVEKVETQSVAEAMDAWKAAS